MKTDINKILSQPANKGYSARGADMGRTSQRSGSPERLHLQKVRLSGDYDAGGAYWGHTPGTSIFCAFSPASTNNDQPIRIFVRAKNRKQAKSLVLDETQEKGFTFFK